MWWEVVTRQRLRRSSGCGGNGTVVKLSWTANLAFLGPNNLCNVIPDNINHMMMLLLDHIVQIVSIQYIFDRSQS